MPANTLVSIDLETRDGGLIADKGSGWPTGDGHICGVAVAWGDRSVYLPVNHPESSCLDERQVRRWTADLLARDNLRFVFHHAAYDLGWLRTAWGIEPPARFDDTSAMAVMLDENRFSYQLNDCCRAEGIAGKDERLLKEAGAAFGFHGDSVKNNLWRLPARFVGPYAEADAVGTLRLAEIYRPRLEEEGVTGAYDVEIGLIPMCLEMRRRGIRVDLDLAEQAKAFLERKRDEQLQILSSQLGKPVCLEHIRQARWLEQTHDQEGISYPRTPKTGRGSFTAGKGGWMRKHEHWLPSTIAAVERYAEAADKFVQGFVLDFQHNGRMHAQINQFRGEGGGTRSHRFSYSDPPLQQMPERDDEIAPLIRGLFLPEESEIWGVHDYSQQEYRMIVHVASILKCRDVEKAVKMYQDDPNTDFHNLVVEWTGLERKSAKDTNFAKAFGAGVPKFAAMIGKSVNEARKIFEQYDRLLPFVSEASRKCNRAAEERGYIKLIDGARCHFDFWVPIRDQGATPMKLERFLKEMGEQPRKRAWVHKAFNRYVQGSAARQTKAAMLWCWREKLVPMLQMHDDLNFSLSCEKDSHRIKEIMRDAIPLRVPVKVDSEYGRSWGLARKTDTYRARWEDAVAS